MNAQIDIKHPSGKSLEGFPVKADSDNGIMELFTIYNDNRVNVSTYKHDRVIQLYPGDKITIEILL